MKISKCSTLSDDREIKFEIEQGEGETCLIQNLQKANREIFHSELTSKRFGRLVFITAPATQGRYKGST